MFRIRRFLKVVEAGWEALLSGVEPAEASDLSDDWHQFHWSFSSRRRFKRMGTTSACSAIEPKRKSRENPPWRDRPFYALSRVLTAGERLLDRRNRKSLEVPEPGFPSERFARNGRRSLSLDVPLNPTGLDRSREEEPILPPNDVDFHFALVESRRDE